MRKKTEMALGMGKKTAEGGKQWQKKKRKTEREEEEENDVLSLPPSHTSPKTEAQATRNRICQRGKCFTDFGKIFFLCLFGESCPPLLLLFLFLPASPNQFRQWGIIPAWKGGGRERTRMGLISLPPSLLLSVAEGRQEGCVYQTNSGSLLLPPAYRQAPSHPRNGGTRKRKTGAASSFA